MMKDNVQHPIHTTIGVKPIVIVPEDIAWKLGERAISREEAQRSGDEAAKELKGRLTVGVEILSPSVVESRDDIERLKADLGDTDAYWVIGGGRGRTTLLLELARRYPHPLIGGGGVGLPPFLRSRGFEAYPSLDDDLLSLLRVRKAIGLTKALVIKSTRIAGGCLSSAWDLADIETRLGVGFDSISNEVLFAEMKGVEREDAQALADELIDGAEEVALDVRYVVKSAALYLAARKLLEGHECNALTVECCDTVSMQLEIEHETVPCLALVLLNDQGLASSCQADISGMLTMMVLIYLSGRSIFLGNLGVPSPQASVISLNHSVPGLKMDGLEAPRLPYSLRPFGVMDWGTAIYVDMMKLKEKVMTVARFDPLVRRLLVTRGELVRSFPVEKWCSQMIYVQVPDATGFVRRAHTDYGGHFTAVSGDHVQQLERLCETLGVELELM
jgi:hypothetical protein